MSAAMDYMPGWTEMSVTYRELVEMPRGQFRLLQIVVARCHREGLSLEDSIEQIRGVFNRSDEARRFHGVSDTDSTT